MPKLLKSQKVLFCVFLVFLLLIPMTTFAAQVTEHIIVKSTDTVNGPGIYGGNTVQIDGTINGTAFAAGQRVVVNGTINGDLLTIGREITINGKISGNLYIAGQRVEVNGQVMGDAFGVGQKVNYTGTSILERDAFTAGQDINIAGNIQRQLYAAGDSINLGGLVGDKARIEANNLRINDGAEINGGLNYTSSSPAYLAPKAKVDGPIDWKVPKPKTTPKPQNTFGDHVGWFILSTLGALLFWFLISLWRPSFWSTTSATITKEPLKTLGLGALALILTPLIVLFLIITIIGIPLAVILGLVYGVSIWLSRIIVAVFVGYWLAQRFSWPELHKGVWIVLLGLAIIALLSKLPFIGFLISLAVVLAGVGAMVLTLAQPKTPPLPSGPPIFNDGE